GILKRRVKSNIRRAFKCRGSKLLAENDTKSAWKFIREVTFSTNSSPKANVDAEVLNDCFAATVHASQGGDLQMITSCDGDDSLSIDTISCTRVEYLLSSLKTATATGHDGLPASILKKLSGPIVPNLTSIINASLSQGIFPELWKKANLVAVWKKGSKSEAENYRPISVLPVLARLFEKK